MKKSNFVALVLAVIGVLFLGLGMSMTTIPEWNMFSQGVVVGVIGIIILLFTFVLYRKMEGKPAIKISAKTLGTTFLAIFAALTLGAGMSLIMVFDQFIVGMVMGVLGIMFFLFLIPMTRGLK